ncbi:MBOAT family protein [bacterium]|nr:MBOAT family protein [bacterium]
MVFSSVTFLFYFLPVVLGFYFLARPGLRNLIFMLAGLVFYLWGAGGVVFILMASIGINWLLGLWAEKTYDALGKWKKRLPVIGAVVINIGILGYYKYANFMIDQMNAAIGKILPGFEPVLISHILLPIGVSFFTFQAMSYVFDIARHRLAPLRNPVDFAMYICMFPQLIAGPIVRYHEIADQIKNRIVTVEKFGTGVVRFCLGLFKKVVLADSIAVLADQIFAMKTDLSTPVAWLGLLAFTVQVYFDFSGYSDMAIGLGQMFGFRLPENFNRPYLAISVTDFWRRWHITLSRWFREYVYIPLGGSKVTAWRIYLNLFIVFVLVGFWHGANWTFLVFGFCHGAFLSVERLFGLVKKGEPQRWLAARRLVTFVLVMLSFVLFRVSDISHAGQFYTALFLPQTGNVLFALDFRNIHALIWMAVGLLAIFVTGDKPVAIILEQSERRSVALIRIGIITVALTLTVMMIVSRNFNPFIYFQF